MMLGLDAFSGYGLIVVVVTDNTQRGLSNTMDGWTDILWTRGSDLLPIAF